jgi:chemotaxis-related protein WspB
MGDERFALDASKVQEVLPVVSMKKIPKAPDWVSGVMRYRGNIVPVIDLCTLNLERSSDRLLSTRIILLHYTAHDKTERLLGLLAEKVTETLRCQAEDFNSTGIKTPDAPHLGGVTSDQKGMLQWLAIDQLLPDKVQKLLFQDEQDANP